MNLDTTGGSLPLVAGTSVIGLLVSNHLAERFPVWAIWSIVTRLGIALGAWGIGWMGMRWSGVPCISLPVRWTISQWFPLRELLVVRLRLLINCLSGSSFCTFVSSCDYRIFSVISGLVRGASSPFMKGKIPWQLQLL